MNAGNKSGKPDDVSVPVLGINRRNLDFVFDQWTPGRFMVLDDKLLTKIALSEAGIPVPETLATAENITEVTALREVLAVHKELVIKPVNGSGGKGILVLARQNKGWVTPSGRFYSWANLQDHMLDVISGVFSLDETGDRALIEECVHPDKFFSDLYPHGLADLRIVVLGGIPVQAMCRVPTHDSDGKANLHSGGVGLGIDIKTGLTSGGVCHDKIVDVHPDTGVTLIDLQIPHWERCLEMAVASSHSVEPSYVGVDIVIDAQRGPLILELNARPGLAIQIANQQPQRVAKKSTRSPLDRSVALIAWVMLACIIGFPAIMEPRWRQATHPTRVLEVQRLLGAFLDEPDAMAEASVTDGSEEAIPVSEIDDRFRAAREAYSAGNIKKALELYSRAAQDSAIAPFALNNMALIERQRGNLAAAKAFLELAIEHYPTYDRGLYHLGLVLRDQGHLDEAMERLRQALELHPSHARSWAALGSIQFQRRQFDEVIQYYESAIQYMPNATNYRIRLGLAHRKLQDYNSAARRFGEALSLDRNSETAAYWWARSIQDLPPSETVEASVFGGGVTAQVSQVDVDSLRGVLEPFVTSEPPSLRCRVLDAALLWEQGHHDLSRRAFERLLDRKHRTRSQRRVLMNMGIDRGLWIVAEKHLPRISSKDHELKWTNQQIMRFGRALEPTSENEMAGGIDRTALAAVSFEHPLLETLRRALLDLPALQMMTSSVSVDVATLRWIQRGRKKTNPESEWVVNVSASVPARLQDRIDNPKLLPRSIVLWALYRVAQSRNEPLLTRTFRAALEENQADFAPLQRLQLSEALQSGKTRAALRLGQKLLKLEKKNPHVLLQMVEVHVQNKNPKEARTLFEQLPATQRRQVEARLVESRLLLAEGKSRHAINILQKLEAHASESVAIRLALAATWSQMGRPERAIEPLRRALEESPRRTDVRRQLAQNLMQMLAYPEAVVEWRHLVQLEPANASHRFNLGLSQQRDKRFVEAVATYDVLVKRRPKDWKAWFNRALAQEKSGDMSRARSGYSQVLVLKPDHDVSRRKLTALQGGMLK